MDPLINNNYLEMHVPLQRLFDYTFKNKVLFKEDPLQYQLKCLSLQVQSVVFFKKHS